jgi:hypothetical protein
VRDLDDLSGEPASMKGDDAQMTRRCRERARARRFLLAREPAHARLLRPHHWTAASRAARVPLAGVMHLVSKFAPLRAWDSRICVGNGYADSEFVGDLVRRLS